MSWLTTFNLMIRSSITTLREKIEDPERLLHQLIVDMEEELDRVRESVAEAIADEIQLGRKVQQAHSELHQRSSMLRLRCLSNLQRTLECRDLRKHRES